MADQIGRARGRKVSYTIPCSSAFRDAIEALANRQGCNAGDLARSVAVMLPPDAIHVLPDPGGPAPGDRETVVRRSGPTKGDTWKRKPRVQVRMAPGFDPVSIRRMLALILALDSGDAKLGIDYGTLQLGETGSRDQAARQEAELERLRGQLDVLSFEPLPGAIETRPEALHVLGFPPHTRPSLD